MCEKAVKKEPWPLKYVPNHFKTQRMCEKAFEDKLGTLEHVPDHLKTQ